MLMYGLRGTDTITIAAAKGATITMKGSVSFAKTTSAGPLITFDTDVCSAHYRLSNALAHYFVGCHLPG